MDEEHNNHDEEAVLKEQSSTAEEQLAAAVAYILEARDTLAGFKAAAEQYKATNDETIEALVTRISEGVKGIVPESVELNITKETRESFKKDIHDAAMLGVKKTQCVLPDGKQLTDSITTAVVKNIMGQLEPKIKECVEKHKTRIDVHHDHHHSSIYGGYASNEKNRKTMCWLGFISFVCVAEMALYLCKYYDVIKWDVVVFNYVFAITIIVAVVGFIMRISSNERY